MEGCHVIYNLVFSLIWYDFVPTLPQLYPNVTPFLISHFPIPIFPFPFPISHVPCHNSHFPFPIPHSPGRDAFQTLRMARFNRKPSMRLALLRRRIPGSYNWIVAYSDNFSNLMLSTSPCLGTGTSIRSMCGKSHIADSPNRRSPGQIKFVVAHRSLYCYELTTLAIQLSGGLWGGGSRLHRLC
jgi:hypothetical protein